MNIDSQLINLLQAAKDNKASDLHIAADSKPRYRIHSELRELDGMEVLSGEDTKRLLFSLLDDMHKKEFEEFGETDLSFGVDGIGRFRVNVYSQRGKCSAALRLMSAVIPDPESLGLPPSVIDLANKHSGMVLVTGPTGSGKSTTLAALLQRINTTRRSHIITLEDPIEYLYQNDKSLVDQREVGQDTKSFGNALRAALREDPDVILVGEMRDLETISTAVTAAETGHLVFSTLHTIGADSTINRIVDAFPEGQKDQIRTQLAMVLESVISQRLIPKADGTGRVACMEIMHCTSAIRSLIREDKTYQIPSMIQTSRQLGMVGMDVSLVEAYQKGIISRDSALEYAVDKKEMENKLGPGASAADQMTGFGSSGKGGLFGL
ncbi:MAG: type IV pilus twitching motility protein PilT [Lachnospiraceae bacterium]|nr:type IV pilus twitching motility protein PilT [Lachnospiraceae bacterium]